MSKIARFVIWICSKFTRIEIEQIITGLSDVIANRNPEVKPKDDFKEKHPNYRVFSVDPLPPLTEPSAKQPVQAAKDYKLLLTQYHAKQGKPLRPVKQMANSPKVPPLTVCPLCNAPHNYIYYNDGKKRSSQFKLCYQYREYHYKPGELNHSQPDHPKVDLSKIHNSPNILGLILTFYVSFAIIAMQEAIRTAKPKQQITLISGRHSLHQFQLPRTFQYSTS